MPDGYGPLTTMELRSHTCCRRGPGRSPTANISAYWWPSRGAPTRVTRAAGATAGEPTRGGRVRGAGGAVTCTFAAITDWAWDLDRAPWGRLGFTNRIPAATTVRRLLLRIDAALHK